MLRISKNASIVISMALTLLFFLVLLLAMAVLPRFVQLISPFALRSLRLRDRLLIEAAGYLILALAVLADALLFRLLLLIRGGEVFTARSVALIRGVSWCAIAISLAFLGMTWYFAVSLVLAFTAVLLGLCLRVVKNVIEEATVIKAENDLTV